MFEAQEINAEHKDLIHDVAYDYYGERMATCSSDQYVKVWDQNSEGKWILTSSWKAHSGSVWKVTWAHPEFGQVLATCSFDRTAAVWEELVGETPPPPAERGKRHWVRRTNLVDSRTSVTDVKFGPKTQGLQLATCSADGVIRIYEAPDVMNLSQWTLQHEVQCKLSCSCLSWNPSLSNFLDQHSSGEVMKFGNSSTRPFLKNQEVEFKPTMNHPLMLAVGSDDTNPQNGGKVFIYEYSDNMRRWMKTETITSITDPVHDISFSPNLGRSFHLLAVATKDVRIINLTPMQDNASLQSDLSKLDIQTSAQFDDHGCTVWRVCWNITGTILASSGDDGCVRMFKMNYINSWKPVAVLKGDGSQVTSETQRSSVSSSAGLPTPPVSQTASTSGTQRPRTQNQTSPVPIRYPPQFLPRHPNIVSPLLFQYWRQHFNSL